MSRLGYICDGCGDEYPRREPPACVQDDDLNWNDLCSDCYDRWQDEGEAVLS